MNDVKRGVLRTTVYLHSVGLAPATVAQSYREQLAALLAQYESLSSE